MAATLRGRLYTPKRFSRPLEPAVCFWWRVLQGW